MIYDVDECAKTFYGDSKRKMAEHWGIADQNIAKWRNAGMFFLHVDGRLHRCNTRGSVEAPRKKRAKKKKGVLDDR